MNHSTLVTGETHSMQQLADLVIRLVGSGTAEAGPPSNQIV